MHLEVHCDHSQLIYTGKLSYYICCVPSSQEKKNSTPHIKIKSIQDICGMEIQEPSLSDGMNDINTKKTKTFSGIKSYPQIQ